MFPLKASFLTQVPRLHERAKRTRLREWAQVGGVKEWHCVSFHRPGFVSSFRRIFLLSSENLGYGTEQQWNYQSAQATRYRTDEMPVSRVSVMENPPRVEKKSSFPSTVLPERVHRDADQFFQGQEQNRQENPNFKCQLTVEKRAKTCLSRHYMCEDELCTPRETQTQECTHMDETKRRK